MIPNLGFSQHHRDIAWKAEVVLGCRCLQDARGNRCAVLSAGMVLPKGRGKSRREECENIGVQKTVVRKFCKKLELLNLRKTKGEHYKYL